MQGSLEFTDESYRTINCEVGSGAYHPIIEKSEARAVKMNCHNPLGIDVITCKHPQKDLFIKEANGLNLDIKLESSLPKLIPHYFSTVDIATRNVQTNAEFVGITLHDLLASGVKTKAGMQHEQKKITFRKNLFQSKAFQDKKIIVFLTGSDTLIEWIWYNRAECEIFTILKEMGAYAVGGFNFSLINGECPFSHALNLKRSLLSCELIEKAGLIAIPHIYAINDYQIQRWIKWLKENQAVTHFTMNCQLQKSISDKNQIVHTVKSLLNSNMNIRAILQGFPLSEIERFGDFLKRISFTDKKPVKYAQIGRKISLSSNRLKSDFVKIRQINTLARKNIITTNNFIDSVVQNC